ncbi:acyltransferase family protein [Dactylosporangium sp. McL0621]|uniref:acyltransferase family protein n=1 Tax=Dactylosporangium sp. McL0621 TaxID=3415678 RepID=UPI003CFAA1AA
MLKALTPSPGTPVRREGRLAALDGMRLVAALLVMLYHYVGTPHSNLWVHPNRAVFGRLYDLANYGYLGVQMFFFISGFVICMSCWDRNLKDFFVSRVVRLYPMYWVAIAISFVVVHLNRNVADASGVIRAPKNLSDLLVNLTMAQDALYVNSVDAVYWTLWAELRFYLLFAIVVAFGLTFRRALAFAVLWLIAAVVCSNVDNPLIQMIVQPMYAPYFITGILLYLIHRFGSTPLLWGLVAVTLLVCQHQVLLDTRHFNQFLHVRMKWTFSMVLVGGFFLVLALAALGKLSWAKWRWLTVAGALTYPLYLLHQDLGVITIRRLKGTIAPWPLLAGMILAMLILAFLCHRLIEKPFAPRFKRLLYSGMNFDPPSLIVPRGERTVRTDRPTEPPATPVPAAAANEPKVPAATGPEPEPEAGPEPEPVAAANGRRPARE